MVFAEAASRLSGFGRCSPFESTCSQVLASEIAASFATPAHMQSMELLQDEDSKEIKFQALASGHPGQTGFST